MFGSKPASAPPTFLPQPNGPVLVAGSAPGYALAADLSQRFALLQLTGSRALESQQQDEAAKQAAVDEVKQTIAEYDKEHPATGPLHVYLMDGKVAAATDEEGASMLKALVSAAMTQPSRTVAALLPEDASCTSVGQLSPATMLASLANTVLAVEGLTILVGKPALEAFLTEGEVSGFNQATDGNENLSPANEGQLGAPANESLVPAVEGLLSGLARLIGPKAPKAEARKVNNITEIDTAIAEIEKTYANPKWVANQKLVTGSISAEGILSAVGDEHGLPQDVLDCVRSHVKRVEVFNQAYNHAYAAWVAQVNPIVKEVATAKTAAAAIAIADAKLAKIKHPGERVAWPTKGLLGNPHFTHGQGDSDNPRSIQVEFLGPKGGTKGKTLHALNANEITQWGAQLVATLKAYRSMYWPSPKPPYLIDGESDEIEARGSEFWEDINTTDSIMDVLWYHNRNDLFLDAVFYVTHSVAEIALALEKWLHRSIKGASVAKESLEDTPTDGPVTPALEGFGDAVKAFRRVFSSKVPHPDGLPKSPNLDVSQPAERQFAKTYLNPSWLSLQKIATGTISGNGIVVDLQVNGALPQDPLAAVSSGGVAIKTYVTSHAAAMQKYLLAAQQLINAHASATDEATKASTAQQLEALVSPFKIGDAQALSKVPGAPSVVETDDDAAVRPSTAKPEAEQIPALTAEQIPQYAKAVLAVMKETYALSSLVGSQLKVFNQLVDMSHDKGLVAKLKPTVASKLQTIAKGKGVWVLFDYCSMLLVQATALERWCYRSVGGKAA